MIYIKKSLWIINLKFNEQNIFVCSSFMYILYDKYVKNISLLESLIDISLIESNCHAVFGICLLQYV